MEKLLKLKLHTALSPDITAFTRRAVKLAQTALHQSLLGHGDLRTGIYICSISIQWHHIILACITFACFKTMCNFLVVLIWIISLLNRAKLDENARLLDFTEKLEAACVGCVESGKMTKDLALLIHGSKYTIIAFSCLLVNLKKLVYRWTQISWFCRVTRDQYLNTEEFIDAVAAELTARLQWNSKL